MTVKFTETLVLTQEERALLDETSALMSRIYDHTALHSELDNLVNAVDSALCDLLDFEYLEVE